MGSAGSGPSGAGESVGLIAAHCRAEQLVFAVLGDGASGLATPMSAAALVAAADHSAWRARRWYEMLPTAPPGPDVLLGPTAGDREMVAGVRRLAVDEVSLVAVATLGLLPLLGRSLAAHLDRTDPVADGPVRRMLGITATDLDADLERLSAVLGRLCTDPDRRRRADRSAEDVAALAAATEWPVPVI